MIDIPYTAVKTGSAIYFIVNSLCKRLAFVRSSCVRGRSVEQKAKIRRITLGGPLLLTLNIQRCRRLGGIFWVAPAVSG